MEKNYLIFLFALFVFLITDNLTLNAQYNPEHYMELKINESIYDTISNYPVLFVINTQALIAVGDMDANGDDIRFSWDCPDNFLSYWIESGINTTSTYIWVKMPILTPSDTGYVRMYYGDTTAAAFSNLNNTFTSVLITSGNITLTGTKYYDYLKVNTGDTIFVAAGDSLKIHAFFTRINGAISGKGRGYAAPSSSTAGNGPGGGGTSTNSGSGGGSYGGVGGTGGYDTGDTPGSGGPTYGTASGYDIAMGSSGGSSDNTGGGSGGGCFILYAKHAIINGSIIMDGNSGVLPGGSRGGGGGAGGGTLIKANHLHVSGNLSAKGGNGSVGTGSANDSGGGGGGGRIKIFHGLDYIMTGTTSVLGGIGGMYGGAAPGQNGGAGTIYIDTATFTNSIVLGTYNYNTTFLSNDTICQGDSIFIGNAYQTTAGTYTDTLMNLLGCDSIVTTQLHVISVDTSVSVAGNALIAGATSATFQWYDCNTSTIIIGATYFTYATSVNGSFAVIVTQNGCTNMSSCYTINVTGLGEELEHRINLYPNPAIDMLFIEGFKAEQKYQVLIMDVYGQVKHKILHQTAEHLKVSMRDLASGIYLLYISNLNDKTEYFSKIIKQ
ncbi:DUF2341 domain-containing protein [candidate division KSB1 bacterium]